MICALPVTVEPFQFSPAEPVAYELSQASLKSKLTIEGAVCLWGDLTFLCGEILTNDFRKFRTG